ncbi:MAG: tRNA (adenosine(37)-N6)-dimethylallyltransferase MiaA [Pseudonocardiales bacterium]|nr:MAG: tRNA (adenosine(37)-N6)-dimethylallyltransferase MiaA [Pseudonocardiales bacterium]
MSRLVAVVGSTATGKSDLAVALALALGGEVVNADSMQLYRGMDIGTAKLTDAQRRGVPHHLLDVWDVTTTANVAEYQRLARGAVDDVLARGATPILVGGSGLYVRAVIDPLTFPGTDAAVRAALETELAADGPQALHDRLRAADPVAALAIGPANGRKIVRALEVVAITGRPFTAALPDYGSTAGRAYDVVQFAIDPPREELARRIHDRVERMFDGGLVTEVRSLDRLGLRTGVTASRALGYAQVLRLLDGEITEKQARALTAQRTRRFAARQRGWFYRDPRIRWLPAAEPELVLELIGWAGDPA